MIKKIKKFFTETSGLAIFSFVISFGLLLIFILGNLTESESFKEFSCLFRSHSSFLAFFLSPLLSGIIALVYVNVNKKIRGARLATLGIVISVLSFFAMVFFSPYCRRATEARIIASMSQIRSTAEVFYDGDYDNLVHSSDYLKLTKDIVSFGGWVETAVHRGEDEYCSYAFLPDSREWYCIDSQGSAIGTNVHPGGRDYCIQDVSYVCPRRGD